MPPRRRNAAASAASSKTATPAPSRSTRSLSSKSTPATSLAPSSEEETIKQTANSKKRRRQDDELDSDALDDSDKENEPGSKPRGRKKRTISKVVIELPASQETVKASKKAAPKTPGPSRSTRPPAKSRVSGVLVSASKNKPSPPVESESEEVEDSEEDDGSEFEGSNSDLEDAPEEDVPVPVKSKSSRKRTKSMDSDALDDDLDEANASEDEAIMLEAAIHASLAPEDEVDENGAGPSKSRPSANTARNKAAAKRAAAAERRLGIKQADSDSEGFELDNSDDDEGSAVLTDDSDAPLGKKSGKQGKKTGIMTLGKMKADRRTAKEALQEEMVSANIALRKKQKELGRKLTPAERTTVMLSVQHPELQDVWGDLERTIKPVAPQKAPQPEGLKVTLLPFQQESLYWMRKQENGPWSGGMLADEMGMGKTIQTLALFVSDRKKPNLVVAPTVALMQWKNEIEAHTEGFKVYMFHGGSREKSPKELAKYDVVLTTYSVLESSFRKQVSGFKRKGEIVKEKSPLHGIDWCRIILDEAHNIKERSTNTAKAAFELKSSYKWCLSGTPLQNRVGELYSLVRFIGGDPFSYYFCKRCPCKSLHWRFSDRKGCDDCGHSPMNHTCFWNNEILTPIQKNGMIGPGATAFKKLRILLDRMMLRRTKVGPEVERADDLGLPPRTVVVRRDYFSPEEKELYMSLFSDAKRQFSTYVDSGTVLNNYSNIFSLLTRMRQMACHPDLVLKSKRNLDLSGHISEAMPPPPPAFSPPPGPPPPSGGPAFPGGPSYPQSGSPYPPNNSPYPASNSPYPPNNSPYPPGPGQSPYPPSNGPYGGTPDNRGWGNSPNPPGQYGGGGSWNQGGGWGQGSPYGGTPPPQQSTKGSGAGGFLGKLLGGSKHGSSSGGYGGGYGGGPSYGGGYGGGYAQQQQPPKKSGGMGAGGMLLAGGAGLVGGALLADAIIDHDQDEYAEGYAAGMDDGGGFDDF
ncbi:unnamed protein product [Rhizoctonia solani]|uniref:Helicase ATP-binding domain-containing protein n=1 Tax=Rhizoctonia solani TaxID=456999 RepID=A0A8H3E596_9AGAM|nr:unnamed protein product [Rhizoctonia solani]